MTCYGRRDPCERCKASKHFSECVCNGEPRKAYAQFAMFGARPAERLLYIHPGLCYTDIFKYSGKRHQLQRFVRATAVCIVDWLKMVGWLERTPCLVAQLITAIVLQIDQLRDPVDHIWRPNGVTRQTAFKLIAEEFDRSWRAIKESVAAHGVAVAERVATRRRVHQTND